MDKKYTSNGKAIRILCIDKPKGSPVIGMIEETGAIHHFKENGESIAYSDWDLVEVWEPHIGEWCWFWDNSIYTNAQLIQYLESRGGLFISIDGWAWDNCSKFEGELPKHLKKDK
jgi:hypothetical protein